MFEWLGRLISLLILITWSFIFIFDHVGRLKRGGNCQKKKEATWAQHNETTLSSPKALERARHMELSSLSAMKSSTAIWEALLYESIKWRSDVAGIPGRYKVINKENENIIEAGWWQHTVGNFNQKLNINKQATWRLLHLIAMMS